MNPWQYKLYFLDLLYGISHGFDITLIVAGLEFQGHFEMIFFSELFLIAYKISTLHIMWP